MMVEEKLEDDLWKIFVSMPQPNILLCATDEEFLKDVLNRMKQKAEKRALPDNLPEWEYVDLSAKYWAVRHYDKDDALLDPSSPLNGKEMAANVPDTQAIGVVFEFDPNRSMGATVKYLSSNKEALKIAMKLFSRPDEGFTPKIKQAQPHVVEGLVSLNNSNAIAMFMLILRGVLGHAIYL
jgi:hypothetical protein